MPWKAGTGRPVEFATWAAPGVGLPHSDLGLDGGVEETLSSEDGQLSCRGRRQGQELVQGSQGLGDQAAASPSSRISSCFWDTVSDTPGWGGAEPVPWDEGPLIHPGHPPPAQPPAGPPAGALVSPTEPADASAAGRGLLWAAAGLMRLLVIRGLVTRSSVCLKLSHGKGACCLSHTLRVGTLLPTSTSEDPHCGSALAFSRTAQPVISRGGRGQGTVRVPAPEATRSFCRQLSASRRSITRDLITRSFCRLNSKPATLPSSRSASVPGTARSRCRQVRGTQAPAPHHAVWARFRDVVFPRLPVTH